jgi:circadian clock protein KaiC
MNEQENPMDLEATEKIPIGIDGFEHLAEGGLPKGRATYLVGTSGSGKTIFAVEFLYRGITEFNRPGVLVTFEECPKDIVRNVKNLGWNLDTLIAQKKLAIVDASPDSTPCDVVGAYDLSGLLAQVEHQVKEVGAGLVVMDSIGALFYQFDNPPLIRREMFRIAERLKALGVTAILTGERLEEYGPISRYGMEEFVSDSVVVLRNVLYEEKCRRTIQILKMRGETHLKGEYPFTITGNGISILALSAMQLSQESSNDRLSTGNVELDRMTNGGIFRDSVFLISGPTGSGKTLMSTMFSDEGCRNKEKVLLLAYEESREQLLRNAQSWGMDFQSWEQKGLLRVVCQYPEAMGLEDHLLMIRREIAEFHPNRMVMDSVSAMERVATVRNFREFVIGLTSFVKQERVCCLMTSTTPQLTGGESVTETHISTITDIIALLRYVEISGELRRGLAVIKMRGSQHDKSVHEYTIDGHGLNVGGRFKNIENILLGVPRVSALAESDQLDGMFKGS